MFLESFEQSNSKREFKQKQIKKQYSAGFRNYHPKKEVIDEEMNTQSESDIFQMLKIGNLKQLYMQTIPKVDNTKLVLEQQKQSIMRLTKMPEKEQKIQINQQDEQKRKENIQLFNKTYHEVQGFCQKGEKMLFQNEYKKVKEKLIQICNKIYKKEVSFKELIVKYVLNYADKYTKKSKIDNDELYLDFSNYLNSLKRSQKQSDKSISSKQLEDLRLKNIFFFGIFEIQKSQKQDFQSKSLNQITRENSEFQVKIQDVRFFINKKITVPLQSTSIHPHRQTKTVEVKQKQEVFQKFHAKPIPKTTYQKPKERPKSHMTKTQPQPFNLTNNNTNIPKIEDYYKWQRQFHAKKVPDTTYRQQKIESGNEDQKRKRALQLLHQSKYPESMKYLNNYKEYNEKRHTQLSQKYTKQRTQQQQRSVPNFAEIHRRHIQTMENKKIENRQLTKTKPFNLSQPRPPKSQKETYVPKIAEKQFDISRKKQIQGEQKIKLQPKSTLKYDTYVNHLKKQKEIKIQQQEIKRKQQKKKQKPQYKQILKERLQDEIKGKSKNFSSQKLTNNTVKVDLQKIYQYEPLLIERETIKSKKQTQSHIKNWQPII